MFDDRVYKRGALTLHALRLTVGDGTFFDILRAWTRTHAHGTVVTDDFVDIASGHSDIPLRELFHSWLCRAPLPDLPELRAAGHGSRRLSVRGRERGLPAPSASRRRAALPCRRRGRLRGHPCRNDPESVTTPALGRPGTVCRHHRTTRGNTTHDHAYAHACPAAGTGRRSRSVRGAGRCAPPDTRRNLLWGGLLGGVLLVGGGTAVAVTMLGGGGAQPD